MEYNLNINAQIDDAERKLDKLDKQLDKTSEKAAGIKIELPNLEQVTKAAKGAGTALKFVWDNSNGLLSGLNPLIGAMGDTKELLEIITGGAIAAGKAFTHLRDVMPTTIVGTTFRGITRSIEGTAQATARLGYVFFGLTQSINLVNQAFGGFFDNTIRRQAELEATILLLCIF